MALIGHAGNLNYRVDGKRIIIEVPAKPPCDYAFAFKLTGFKTGITPEADSAREAAFKKLQSELNNSDKSKRKKSK